MHRLLTDFAGAVQSVGTWQFEGCEYRKHIGTQSIPCGTLEITCGFVQLKQKGCDRTLGLPGGERLLRGPEGDATGHSLGLLSFSRRVSKWAF